MQSLTSAISLSEIRLLSDLEKQGLMLAFEFAHELAWNALKDYFSYQGTQGITVSRDATREAFSKGLIEDGDGWMAMIQSRNKTSHTYNQAVANEIVEAITNKYFMLLKALMHKLLAIKDFEDKIDDLYLPWKVDLSLKHQIDNPALIQHIENVGISFYSNRVN